MHVSKKHFAGLTFDTVLLALASLFSDVASEMLYPVLPIFLTQTLGASGAAVGLIDGMAQATQNIVQGGSGWLSDRLRARKLVALAGLLISALAKPLIGWSTSWLGVLGARNLDRVGSGIKSAPRDALVAASTDEANRGKAFGLEGFGDNLGAFVGPLIAVALLSWWHVELRTIFFLALIPGLLAAVMVLPVREKRDGKKSGEKLAVAGVKFPSGYWRYLAATAIFGVGNSSNAFLILRSKGLGASLSTTILIYAAYNLVAALASYPAGHLSDVIGRKRMVLISFGVFVVVYAGFGLAKDVISVAVLFAIYGLYQGIYRSVGKAMATDFLPAGQHAGGVGWFTATVGFTGMVAGVVGGLLWTKVGPAGTFFYGAGTGALGGLALAVMVPGKVKTAKS